MGKIADVERLVTFAVESNEELVSAVASKRK